MVLASIVWVDEAASTNTLLASQSADLPHGTVIAARKQTAGRGQRGNSWESDPGANLTFSLLLRPTTIMAARQFELSMIVSLGVCDALADVSGLDFKVKWPNDIYAGDQKICGILIENSLEGKKIGRSIVGIGINVNQEVFTSDAPNPVSLINLTGRSFDLHQLLEDVCDAILTRLSAYETIPDVQALTEQYHSKLWRATGFHRWLDAASDAPFDARIDRVAPDGMLTLIGREGDHHVYAFKEVAAVL